MPPAAPSGQRDRRLRLAADNLRVDVVTAEVVTALRDAGIPSILLKGPAIVRWLYEPDRLRQYGDADLLVPPPTERAEAVLQQLGFEPLARQPAGWPTEHAHHWTRSRDGGHVDLHVTFHGMRADHDHVWRVLSSCTRVMSVGGSQVTILDPRGLCLIVALHAAGHGVRASKPVEDLDRAVDRAPFELWSEAMALAASVDALDAFAAGLRMRPRGAVLAEKLELPAQYSTTVALQAASAGRPPESLEYLSSLSGARSKVAFAALKLVPPPAYLRLWLAERSRRPKSLVLGYPYRFGYVVLQTLPAFVTWRQARRRAARPSGRSPRP